MESIESVLKYVEAQFNKPFADTVGSQGDFVSLLSGSGGVMVDVVFYMIAQGMSSRSFPETIPVDDCYRSQRRGHYLPPTSSSTYQYCSSNRKVRHTIPRRD